MNLLKKFCLKTLQVYKVTFIFYRYVNYHAEVFLLLMDYSYVIAFYRQNAWTSKRHHNALDVTVNRSIIRSVIIFKEFDCKVKLL